VAIIQVKCPLCQSCKVVKFGTSPEGKQRYQCRNDGCKKNTFLLDYTHKGYLPDIKQKIIEMAMNGSGIRDTSRVLGIGQNTVISELKKKKQKSKI
jgi:transposase-like protein